MFRPPQPTEMFSANNILLVSLAKTLFPNATYSCTFPSLGSGQFANIVRIADGFVVGAVYAPPPNTPSILVQFLNTEADETATFEFGKIAVSGAMAMPLAVVNLSPLSGEIIEDVNPCTGFSTPGTDWQLFKFSSVTTAFDNFDSVYSAIGDSSDTVSTMLQLNVSDAPYYYIGIKEPGGPGPLSCYFTPTAFTFIPLPVAA